MDDNDQGESLAVPEPPLMCKLAPRLLRTLSSESNLQTISLGTTSDNDTLATISLAEIGGIPQGGATTPLDPNLLIGLSPETLNMMTTPFQFLPSSSATNELSIGGVDIPSSSVGDLDPLIRSSADRETVTTSVTSTNPVTSCLSSFSSDGIRVGKHEKSIIGPAVPLGAECISSDSSVVTIINGAINRNPQIVAGMNCEQPNVVVAHSQDSMTCNSSRTLTFFSNSHLQSRAHGLNSNNDESSQGGVTAVQAFLNGPQPGPSDGGLGLSLSRPSVHKPCTPNSLLNLPNTVEDVSVGAVSATRTTATEELQGQSSLMSSSENNVQYVSINVPNVEINSSGQLVISHVSLLQAPQSSSFIPLVTQSMAAPVISQTEVPDSTSEGLVPTVSRRKGGWPKGKRRKVNPVEATQVPKAPTTSYMIFFRENRERIEKENEHLPFKDLLKVIGNKWATLTETERKVYTDKAARLKRRYLAEVKSHAQTEAYQTLIRKEAIKKLSNADGDFPGSDDILFMSDFSLMEEDPLNPNELYCKVCDQYFSNIHNKKEHLSGRQHVRTVSEKLYSYSQQQIPPDISDTDSLEGLEESVKKELANLNGIRAEIMELHAQRELEVKSLKREATDNLLKNMQLNRELKDLQETYQKLESNLKNLKTIEASLQTKLNGLRLLMTLFGVLNFN